MSSKKDKFQRLANKRLDKSLMQLDLVANLSASRYECEDKDADQLTEVLRSKLNYIEELFEKRKYLNSKKNKRR
ncbi:hypothetical protein [Bacillus subtilis]|uniref:hypothetical protein n=1 Tax=Bacillus subtilis TaxID=1423 RepID=UPI001E5A4967|nr:hypothetical protein [Bacillus subtilis]